jgi:hypothetical protein
VLKRPPFGSSWIKFREGSQSGLDAGKATIYNWP